MKLEKTISQFWFDSGFKIVKQKNTGKQNLYKTSGQWCRTGSGHFHGYSVRAFSLGLSDMLLCVKLVAQLIASQTKDCQAASTFIWGTDPKTGEKRKPIYPPGHRLVPALSILWEHVRRTWSRATLRPSEQCVVAGWEALLKLKVENLFPGRPSRPSGSHTPQKVTPVDVICSASGLFCSNFFVILIWSIFFCVLWFNLQAFVGIANIPGIEKAEANETQFEFYQSHNVMQKQKHRVDEEHVQVLRCEDRLVISW